ncbi:Spa2p [Pseudohyphozyma bogoriensis]|nr:Spa2p [Pseudohyphozyma bogoriensis]
MSGGRPGRPPAGDSLVDRSKVLFNTKRPLPGGVGPARTAAVPRPGAAPPYQRPPQPSPPVASTSTAAQVPPPPPKVNRPPAVPPPEAARRALIDPQPHAPLPFDPEKELLDLGEQLLRRNARAAELARNQYRALDIPSFDGLAGSEREEVEKAWRAHEKLKSDRDKAIIQQTYIELSAKFQVFVKKLLVPLFNAELAKLTSDASTRLNKLSTKVDTFDKALEAFPSSTQLLGFNSRLANAENDLLTAKSELNSEQEARAKLQSAYDDLKKSSDEKVRDLQWTTAQLQNDLATERQARIDQDNAIRLRLDALEKPTDPRKAAAVAQPQVTKVDFDRLTSSTQLNQNAVSKVHELLVAIKNESATTKSSVETQAALIEAHTSAIAGHTSTLEEQRSALEDQRSTMTEHKSLIEGLVKDHDGVVEGAFKPQAKGGSSDVVQEAKAASEALKVEVEGLKQLVEELKLRPSDEGVQKGEQDSETTQVLTKSSLTEEDVTKLAVKANAQTAELSLELLRDLKALEERFGAKVVENEEILSELRPVVTYLKNSLPSVAKASSIVLAENPDAVAPTDHLANGSSPKPPNGQNNTASDPPPRASRID